jgi:hypothetical protein
VDEKMESPEFTHVIAMALAAVRSRDAEAYTTSERWD